MAATRPFEEFTRVYAVTTIASIAAPTVAELNAGTDITAFLTKDGLKMGPANNTIDDDGLDSSFIPKVPGSYGFDIELMLKRKDAGGDTAWNLFKTRNAAMNIVVRRLVAYTTAWATSQKVEVYPVATMALIPNDSGPDTRHLFTAPFAVTATPNLDATVA